MFRKNPDWHSENDEERSRSIMISKKQKYRLNRKKALLGIISFAGFLYATTYAHEFGHVLVCASEGHDWRIHINPYTFETRAMSCSERPDNYLLYWSLGGIMGMIVGGVPLAILRRYKLVVIGAVPNVIANAITGSMETFVHNWYAQTPDIAAIIASVPMVTILMALLFKYAFTKVDSPKPLP